MVLAEIGVADEGELPSGLSPEIARAIRLIETGCKRLQPIGSEVRERRIERLTAAGGWTEAALALVEAELPDWQVRRLERDGAEWFCTLSRHPGVPREFDDAVDGRATLLPLAIVDALLEARRRPPEPPTAPSADRLGTTETVWCENCF